MSFPSNFTEQEQADARRFLAGLGIHERGGALDAVALLGYLAAVIRFAMMDFPAHAALRIAAARYEQYEQLAYAAAIGSDPNAGHLVARAAPDEPPLIVEPASPHCLVDPVTSFCQTHQGVHPSAEVTDDQLERVLTHLREHV